MKSFKLSKQEKMSNDAEGLIVLIMSTFFIGLMIMICWVIWSFLA